VADEEIVGLEALGEPLATPTAETQIITYLPEVQFETRRIAPFAPTYVAPDDHLAIEITNTVPGATVSIVVRFLAPGGLMIPTRVDFRPPATGVPLQDVIGLREGWLYGISVRASGLGFGRSAYVRVGLQRGLQPGGHIHQWWIEDIVTDDYSPSWPVGRQVSLKEILGITDYDVFTVTSADVESFPQAFSATTRRVDITVRTNPVLFRFYRANGTAAGQFRIEAGTTYSLDGAFSAFTVQSAVAGSPATVQVVGWR